MTCPRCYRNVPPGTTITPCCGIWVYTNGPADPGHVFYDGNKVDLDLTELRLMHQEASEAYHAQNAGWHDGHLRRHNKLVLRQAAHVLSVKRQLQGLLALGLLDLVLTLLKVHV